MGNKTNDTDFRHYYYSMFEIVRIFATVLTERLVNTEVNL